jgi:cytidine deaminase
MEHVPLDTEDGELVEAARAVIRRNYWPERHVVGAAIRCPSGRVYTGVNVSGAGVCAEIVALGAAISAGEREFACVAAVEGWTEERALVPPCGRCRQVFADYAPEVHVVLLLNGRPVKVRSADLLPLPYHNFDDIYSA